MPRRIEMPVPFPIGTVNAWWCDGDRPALVDCGIGTPDSLETILALRPDGDFSGVHVLLTHGHVDHAGNAAALVARGATLAAAADESPFVETFRHGSARRNDRFRDALVLHGMPRVVADQVRQRSDAIDAHTQDVRIARHLADGDRVVLGAVEAVAHHVPGHTPGSMVYATEEGQLLSGDTLLETITSNAIELLPEDEGRFAAYVRSLEGLRRFVGHEVLPGHHAPFLLTDTVLDHHLDRHARRATRILGLLVRPRSAWDLLPSVFPRLRDDQWSLAMSDVVGHLHRLEQEGRARRVEQEGVRRFVAC